MITSVSISHPTGIAVYGNEQQGLEMTVR